MSASASLPTTAAADSPILAIEQLHIGIRQADRSLRRVVEDFQLSIGSGEIAALVGESGSGKTMIGRAIMRLLPGSAQVEHGRILLDGTDVAQASAARMRQLRGRAVGMVFQEPMVSLNPAIRVGQQMSEALRLHYGLGPEQARQRCLEMLERVRIADPVGCFQSYPHQFSGGMRQRIMLASVLAMQPRLLIADEPTTALDALVRKEVMDIMQALTREMGIAVLLVSHDLSMVAGYADQVTVLRLGRTMEQGPASRILLAPQQAYTRALLAALPARTEAAPAPGAEAPPLVEVSGLCVDYKRARSLLQRGPSHIRVVHETDFVLHPGQTLAVVGESGSGKSTLGRALVRLLKESAGSIRFEGQEVTALQGRALDPLRPKLQMVFQDPFSSLDPRMDLTAIVAEGLRNLPGLASAERQQRARAMLAEVGLPGDFARRYPHELSGGQRQRVCIARAIVAEPRLVVADEPVSALDVTVQEQVLALLRQLQKKFGFSYLFISHDLAVVEQVADRVAVMYRGRLLEIGSRDALFDRPQHPYTRRLLQATPRIRPTGENSYALVADEPPVQPAPAGYRHYNHGSIPGAALSTGVPVMVEVGDDHRVACVPLS